VAQQPPAAQTRPHKTPGGGAEGGTITSVQLCSGAGGGEGGTGQPERGVGPTMEREGPQLTSIGPAPSRLAHFSPYCSAPPSLHAFSYVFIDISLPSRSKGDLHRITDREF
jgi:hypothetical protein